MSWVNLNDVYVNKTGDTITGDLAVNGALTANGALTVKKDSTTYNVADEISTLRDSVCPNTSVTDGSLYYEKMGKIVWLRYDGKISVPAGDNNTVSWSGSNLGTLPEGYRPYKEAFTPISMDNVSSYNVCAFVTTSGKVSVGGRGSAGWNLSAGSSVSIRFSLFFFTA